MSQRKSTAKPVSVTAAHRGTKKQKKILKAKKWNVSSVNWMQRHINDPYVTAAQKAGYKSRAAFKLVEINDKFRLFGNKTTNANILDLGSAPGSWLQVLAQSLQKKQNNHIIGIDLQEIEKSDDNIQTIEGDFRDETVIKKLFALLESSTRPFDLILSDMAPATSGDKIADHIKITTLLNLVVEFSTKYLKPEGNLIMKSFAGEENKKLVTLLKKDFEKVAFFKPKSSYKDSSEIFIVALKLRS